MSDRDPKTTPKRTLFSDTGHPPKSSICGASVNIDFQVTEPQLTFFLRLVRFVIVRLANTLPNLLRPKVCRIARLDLLRNLINCLRFIDDRLLVGSPYNDTREILGKS